MIKYIYLWSDVLLYTGTYCHPGGGWGSGRYQTGNGGTKISCVWNDITEKCSQEGNYIHVDIWYNIKETLECRWRNIQ